MWNEFITRSRNDNENSRVNVTIRRVIKMQKDHYSYDEERGKRYWEKDFEWRHYYMIELFNENLKKCICRPLVRLIRMMHYAIELFSSATCYKIKVSELLCSCNGCVFTHPRHSLSSAFLHLCPSKTTEEVVISMQIMHQLINFDFTSHGKQFSSKWLVQ